MRVVLDTNVLVSALLNPFGAPGRVLDAVLAGDHLLLVDDRITAEYSEVLHRPRFGFDPADVTQFPGSLGAWAEHVVAPPATWTLPDPDDLPFAEVAIAGAADCLVTGNPRHFVAKGVPATLRVITPAEFIGRA